MVSSNFLKRELFVCFLLVLLSTLDCKVLAGPEGYSSEELPASPPEGACFYLLPMSSFAENITEIQRRTIEDFYQIIDDLPEGIIGEVIEGELHVQPPPSPPHQYVKDNLSLILKNQLDPTFNPSGTWRFYTAVRVFFGPEKDNGFAPDLCGWRTERLYDGWDDGPSITIIPDWVCEILFPGKTNVRRDREDKMKVYSQRVVPYYWIIDPEQRVVEVYKNEYSSGELRSRLIQKFQGERIVRAEPFNEVELNLALLWRNARN